MGRTSVRSGRILLLAALISLVAYMGRVGAADVADDEFKVIVDQEGKILTKGVVAVEKAMGKAKKSVERNASNGAKSSAMILAAIANERIAGKDPAADAKAAGIRDAAIQLYKDASEKNFKAIAEGAKAIADAKPGNDAKKLDISKAFGEPSVGDVMHNFLRADQYGTNAEADIIANAKKPVAKPEATIAIAHRVLAMYEYSKTVSNAEGADKKKQWDEFNEKMKKATTDLLAAGRAKKTGADLGKVYLAVDGSCKACHNVFKSE